MNIKHMKKLMFVIFCIFNICVLSGCKSVRNFIALHQNEGSYNVLRLNSSTNLNDTTDYIYRKSNFYFYSLIDNEFVVIPTEDKQIFGYASSQDYVFYTVNAEREGCYELWRYDIETKVKELLLISEYCQIAVCGNYLFYGSDGGFDADPHGNYMGYSNIRSYAYMFPISGHPLNDSIDLNTLFSEDNQSGDEQYVIYQGVLIGRYYDPGKKVYILNCVSKEETGVEILFDSYIHRNSDDQRILLWRERNKENQKWTFYYQYEGDKKAQIISCLDDVKYEKTKLRGDNVVFENGKIIGLLTISKHPFLNDTTLQEDVKHDVLFLLDPQTGESKILYEPYNNRTRIIGYREGTIFLMKNHTIYSLSVESEEKTELFGLPEGQKFIFDWQNDYLIVRYDSHEIEGNKVAVVYKLE